MGLEITHLRHVGLFTPDLVSHARFYSEIWGLQIVSQHEGSIYFRGASDEFYLLSLHASHRKGIRHISFGLPNDSAVNAAAETLRRTTVPILQEPTVLDEPGGGYGFQFVDPDGRCIELSSGVAAPRTEWQKSRVEPISICHVVLNTPDIDRITAFYSDVLGFRVSDWSEHQMVFLRCSSKHHAISFNRAPHASLNHVAYLVSGVDEVMRGLSTLRANGIEPAWGPGRHGPGNNIFCYFKDPKGYVTEYTSDIDYILDESKHHPRVWSRSPDAIDRWGIAGPPGPAVREAMTGEPDAGWVKGNSNG
jgi:catechol 2,3-dioxygenase-like lactoylglutathione lyase family enzyme